MLQAAAVADAKWFVKQIALDSEPRTLMFNVMRSDRFSSLHEPDHSETDAFVQLNDDQRQVPVSTETLDVSLRSRPERNLSVAHLLHPSIARPETARALRLETPLDDQKLRSRNAQIAPYPRIFRQLCG
jgi:hypothetical protein